MEYKVPSVADGFTCRLDVPRRRIVKPRPKRRIVKPAAAAVVASIVTVLVVFLMIDPIKPPPPVEVTVQKSGDYLTGVPDYTAPQITWTKVYQYDSGGVMAQVPEECFEFFSIQY